MSDKEDSLPGEGSVWEDNQSPDVGGAYGGGEPARSLTPQSDSVDNISMEVQFEEMSSRHPSEISSLSYQNMLEDGEGSGIILSRHESEDSNDSFPPDFGETFPHEDLEVSTRMTDLPTEITEKYRDNFEKKLAKSDLEKENEQLSKVKLRDMTGFQKDAKLGLEIDSQKSHLVSKPLQEQQDNKCYQQSTREEVNDLKEITKKRNSLEVRNNIPVVGEVKNYEKDVTNLTYSNQGAKPKIRKQSPGLACRVSDGSGGSGSDREGSSSEREIDKPMKISAVKPSNLIQPTCLSGSHVESKDSNQENFTNNKIIPENLEIFNQNGVDTLGRRNEYIENEYDYVKYARIQDGNSYVGMRLAYSSTEETKRNSLGINGLGHNELDISREGSPEKNLHPKQELCSQIPLQQVNEDTLTEIPLNNNNGDIVLNDENKAFSLSPENTECDSVEVESVLSDGEKSNIGMPMVEDGLSSSQGSDMEDNVPNPVHSSPTLLLRKKQKAEVEQVMLNLESPDKPKEIDAQAIMEDLKAKREALDLAISDIKSAIQKSKGISLQSPYKEESDNSEPVWVMREPYNGKVQRKEETERLREEINRLQDEDMCREHDKVYQMESEKDRLLENQFSRNDDKSYQPPRGYDSDDEEDKDVKYTKRLRGKKYASLPIDDSYDHRHSVNGSNCVHRHHDVKFSRSDSDSIEYSYTVENQQNSDTLCSDSEEYGSDGEAPSKTAYLKQRTEGDFDTDEETDILLQKQYQKDQYVDIPELTNPPVNRSVQAEKRRSRAKEGEKGSLSISDPNNPTVLIEGVLFRAKYLGSTQLISEGQPSKAMRMMQAQEAVGRIKTLGTLHFGQKFQAAEKQAANTSQSDDSAEEKAPEGENQPSTEVDLFVSTEKIMVLNTDLQEIMMDHSLRTISYIADIGEIIVIMARRRVLSSPGEDSLRRKKQAKILCHVFESEEAQLIAQSIGQAFQVAYMEFLKANGIEDPGLMKEIDYQDVLNQQEIYGEELNLFANKELHKEVIVPKLKSEPLGIVIVESGWGSMVPTVVLANMCPSGPAARCGHLNIGDQIISINGISLVGLPLSSCQTYIKGVKHQTVVKLTVVPCPPVVEVLVKRPDVKYQLGFSVQNGVICSLLRGGIAERGGVRVGHRIIEINSQSVVAVPHEKIVSLLANSVGEIHMKTMPTSIFRLLTGQETPHYL